MTWNAFHHRGDVLRTVIAAADERRDGVLPLDVDGVAQTFEDDLAVLSALQLRWHTRLAGRIERNLMNQPLDLEAAVIASWQQTADELPGIRAIIDHYSAAPTTDAMAKALVVSAAKEHQLLAVMAGRANHRDEAAAHVGAEIARKARETWVSAQPGREITSLCLLDRIKAAIAA
jgi:hypothetical protein